ncbi:ER membrane protein complex subunit 1 isoform X2 [Anabrus simplex]|uniref:ER membrane protein complex subunit 1 isoform X2 n=1 Tax=Anabrus simplex TaxID=316456 RepID=UPI0035A37323
MCFIQLKRSNDSIFSYTYFIPFICVFLVFFQFSLCLYEDQIGKFDWRQTYVGKVKFAEFDAISPIKKVFVATEENVIAALNLKSGHILWRQVLEKDKQGVVHYMTINSDVLITVSGENPTVVRHWDLSGGFLTDEWTLPIQPSAVRSNNAKWFISDQKQLVQVLYDTPPYITVTSFNITSGSKLSVKKITSPVSATESQCVLSAPFFACLATLGESITLHSVKLASSNEQFQSKSLTALLGGGRAYLESIDGSQPLVAVRVTGASGKHIFLLHESGPEPLPYQVPADAKLLQSTYEKTDILLQIEHKDETLEVVTLEAGEQSTDVIGKVKYPLTASSLASVDIAKAVCSPRKDKGIGCRILLSSEDHAVAVLHFPGKLMWIREEALASIIALEMLDLPVSDTDAAIEKEFDHNETGFMGMFAHRLMSQFLQLRLIFMALLGLGEQPSPGQSAGLVRDEFGLHKIIVAATSVGKLFGIDNLSGEILWQHYLKDVASYSSQDSNKKHMILYVQRTTRHFPYQAQCALLARSKTTGEGMLYAFNPFSGQGVDGNDKSVRLGYKVKQSSLLHQPNEQFLRGILLLDDQDKIHVYPESTYSVAASVASTTFIFTADPGTGVLAGYALANTKPQGLVASRVWEVKLSQSSQRITAVVGKSPVERVHSQGRVLGDRSVLYKYINPNLVAVVTQGFDPVHKHFLNVYLVDVVSGAVVFSISHKRAREPVHLVHSENWVLYSYFSDKSRRTEIVTLELYEGKVQSNTTAFSSVASPVQPIVDQQAYILPASIATMKETITEKGITSKHILVALTNGGILELPWMFVDPRRPITVTPEMREEGVIPYMPELPVSSESIINYNQTVQRVRGIHTAPSGLESTCLVLVYGLDLFYTRVTPSKTFDVLKEDFDHFLITAVLLGLTAASYITRKLASRKALKQAWK